MLPLREKVATNEDTINLERVLLRCPHDSFVETAWQTPAAA